jgi:hypothetical protein
MAHAYTPGLRITDSTVLRKERRLPLPGTVHVEVGQQVTARDLVASTALPGNVTTVNISRELNLQPEEVPAAMLKAEGDPVQAGEFLAETRALWGLFHSTARSSVSGTIEAISAVTGQVLVRGEPIPVNLEAYLGGKVVEVLGNEGVVVEAHCALLQGIFGLGGEAYGEIALRASGPDEILDASALDESCEGKVIVGGSLVTGAALQRAVELKARGIVVGGIGHRDLDDFLGYPLGVAITGHEQKGITLVVTEGFGRITMAQRSFDLLKAREGQEASINGATQIRAGVIRPEVIVTHSQELPAAQRAEAQDGGLRIGAPIRLIRDPYFGVLATVAALPEELQTIETEAQVRILVAELPDGRQVVVPRANVETIES